MTEDIGENIKDIENHLEILENNMTNIIVNLEGNITENLINNITSVEEKIEDLELNIVEIIKGVTHILW